MKNQVYLVLSYFPIKLKTLLEKEITKFEIIQEIRVRVNKPLCILANSKNIVIKNSLVSKNDIETLFNNICEYSIYSYHNEINSGFITLKGGNRVGICGTAVIENKKIVSIKDISSLNFRISNDFIGCAENIINNSYESIILAGPPASGKTTLLRDIARTLSGNGKKVCIVDERFEISGVGNEFDLGVMTDCLRGYEKSFGISLCVRTLSPEFIIFDEIGTLDECESVFESLNSGVNIITSVHCYSKEQFFSRPICKKLISSNFFNKVVFLDKKPGEIKEILRLDKSLCG